MSSGISDDGFSPNPSATTQGSKGCKSASHGHRRHLPRHVRGKPRPVSEISQVSASGNGFLKPTNSFSKLYRHSQTRSYANQAVSSFGARLQAGVPQSLVGCSRAEVLDDNYDSNQLDEVLRKCEGLTLEPLILGKSAAQKCHNSSPISGELDNFVHHSLSFPSHNHNTGDSLGGSGPSSPGQDLDYGDISQCPSLIADSEDNFEYSDSEAGNVHVSHTSEHSEALVIASTLAAYLLVLNKGNVSESKKDKRQSYIQSAGSKSDSVQDSRDDYSSCSSRNSRARKRNRHRVSRDEESVDGSGDEARKRPRRTSSATGDKVSGAVSLLACPFYKFDRWRYSEVNLIEKEYRGCSSVYMTDISRLKQHLYRVHGRPDHYCSSCYKVFDVRSQLDSHIRQRPPCENAKPMFTEKITDQQLTQLKKKQYGKTMAQNWYAIFKILFPQAELPESPYLEDPRQVSIRTSLSLYQEVILPRLMQELGLDETWRQAVNSILEQTSSQVLQQLARERVPPPMEGSNQQPPPQSGCTSYQTYQSNDSDYLYTDTHTSNSFNTPELAFASMANGGPYEPAHSQQISSNDIALSLENLGANSSFWDFTPQYHHSTFAEPAEQVLGMSLNFPEVTWPYFDSELVVEDDPQPSRTYSN